LTSVLGAVLAVAQLRGRTERAVGLAFDHQQRYRTVTVDLQDQRPVELQRRRQQQAGRAQLPEPVADRTREGMSIGHLAPRGIERDHLAAHRRALQHEALQRVGAGNGGGRPCLAHASIRRRRALKAAARAT
jgi:hypothetical protein